VGVKRLGREIDHSPPSAEVKEYVELYPQSPIRLHGVVFTFTFKRLHGVVLRHRDNFTAYFIKFSLSNTINIYSLRLTFLYEYKQKYLRACIQKFPD
jgi:hypothetical protein